MKNIEESTENKWVLVDKKNKILFSSDSLGEVTREGNKYPLGDVSIEKKMNECLCFF